MKFSGTSRAERVSSTIPKHQRGPILMRKRISKFINSQITGALRMGWKFWGWKRNPLPSRFYFYFVLLLFNSPRNFLKNFHGSKFGREERKLLRSEFHSRARSLFFQIAKLFLTVCRKFVIKINEEIFLMWNRIIVVDFAARRDQSRNCEKCYAFQHSRWCQT